jgi:hypothetical protein
MQNKNYKLSRRAFLKTAGFAGVGSLLDPLAQTVAAADNPPKVPKRRFGKTGVDVSGCFSTFSGRHHESILQSPIAQAGI